MKFESRSTGMYDNDFSHIQIGSGNLALGLIVPVAVQSSINPLIVNRTPGNGDKEKTSRKRCEVLHNDCKYSLRFHNNDIPHTIIDNFSFQYLDDDIPSTFLDSPYLLITTAVRQEGIQNILNFIEETLAYRSACSNRESFTYFVACENIPNNSQYLKEQIFKHIDLSSCDDHFQYYLNNQCAFLNTIVDRTCKLQNETLNDNEVSVLADNEFDWIIDIGTLENDVEKTEPLQSVFDEDMVTFASGQEYEFYEKRKRWLVNGSHIALATFAFDHNYKYLAEAYRDQKVRAGMNDIFHIYTTALRAFRDLFITNNDTLDWCSDESIYDYAVKVATRFKANQKDTAKRILQDIMKTTEAEGILKKLVSDIEKNTDRNTSALEHLAALVHSMNIDRFAGKMIERWDEPVRLIREYDRKTDGQIFRDDFDMVKDILHMYSRLLHLVNSLLSSQPKTVTRVTVS